MKANYSLVILLLLGVFSQTTAQSEEKDSLIGKPFPNHIFNNVHYYKNQSAYISESINLEDLKGKWVILDFWTRTCGPCIRSFPNVNQWQKDFKDDAQFILVGVNNHYNYQIESYYAGVKAAQGLDLVVAYDSTLWKKAGAWTVPRLFIIDPKGIVKDISITSDMTKEKLEAIIRKK